MSLKDQLTSELRKAMKEGDVEKRSTMRFLLAALHNEEIALQKELDGVEELQVLNKQAQQRRDSIEAYDQAGRADLSAKETVELEIIKQYLPDPLSIEEIDSLIDAAIMEVSASSSKDMGKVMGKLMPQIRGRADGKEVSEKVRHILGEG